MLQLLNTWNRPFYPPLVHLTHLSSPPLHEQIHPPPPDVPPTPSLLLPRPSPSPPLTISDRASRAGDEVHRSHGAVDRHIGEVAAAAMATSVEQRSKGMGIFSVSWIVGAVEARKMMFLFPSSSRALSEWGFQGVCPDFFGSNKEVGL